MGSSGFTKSGQTSPLDDACTNRCVCTQELAKTYAQPFEKVVGRFAPSPTGRMHAGNIFASLMSWLVVKSCDGQIVLRIEDLDSERSRQTYIDQIMRDYEYLGLTWDLGPYYQQGRRDTYQEAFNKLQDRGLVYPCFCSRADLHASSAPHRGEKLVYAGTCRGLSTGEIDLRKKTKDPAYRVRCDGGAESYELVDMVQGYYCQNLAHECGDFIVKRSDGEFAYQLAVVVDDAEQGVNCIVRGMDLLCSTPQQMYLQDLLNYEHPEYAHVPLFVSQYDRRLSKRDHDAGIEELVGKYQSAPAVIGHIAYIAGIIEHDEPATCEEILEQFSKDNLESYFPNKIQILWQA